MKKNKFYHSRSSTFLKDVDIAKILVSKKIYFAEKIYKYFIGHLYNDHQVKPLHVMLLKTSAYVKSYHEQTKWMYFLTGDDELLAKYNTIWDKEFLETKIKSYGDEVTGFYDN